MVSLICLSAGNSTRPKVLIPSKRGSTDLLMLASVFAIAVSRIGVAATSCGRSRWSESSAAPPSTCAATAPAAIASPR